MNFVGSRCKVCIGCGRCNRMDDEIHVVSDSYFFEEEGKALPGEEAVAVDIGTTTIAIACLDREGKVVDTHVKVNPQRIFGADVLSRIEKAENRMLLLQMSDMVKKVIREAIDSFRQKGYAPKKGIIAGNTAEMYLLLQHAPEELGHAPFRAEHLSSETVRIAEIEFQTVPGFSAFVGGDLMAGLIAANLSAMKGASLLVDLGTNGEILLVNQGRILGTSTAAGPAFEGGSGKGDFACDRIKRVVALYEKGYLEENGNAGKEWLAEEILVGDYPMTLELVQAVLVAKAAVRAGIEILLKKAGLHPEQIERVYLAGGFGYFLDGESAVKIGLFPKEFGEKICAVGNSSLAGAMKIVRADTNEYLKRMSILSKEAEIVNLAEEVRFSEIFTAHMGFET